MPEQVSDSADVGDETGRSRLDLRADKRLAELATCASETAWCRSTPGVRSESEGQTSGAAWLTRGRPVGARGRWPRCRCAGPPPAGWNAP